MDGTIFINFSDGNKSNKIYDISNLPGYEVADVISVNSLFTQNNLCSNEIKLDEQKTYTYVSTQEHKSVVLKFLYDARNVSTIDCQFHFSNTWLGDNHGGIIWLRNDKNRISKVSSGYVECNSFSSAGLYEVEIGKLYITSGTNAGKYLIYLSVDGVKMLEYIIASMPDSNSIFITGTSGDYLYDINYLPVELSRKVSVTNVFSETGIEFNAKFRKDFKDELGISEAGFIIYSENDSKNTKKVAGQFAESGNNYSISATVSGLTSDPSLKYIAKFYYVTIESDGTLKTHYKDTIVSSLYDSFDSLESLDSTKKALVNEYKDGILYVLLDVDTCEISGANKTGDFESSSIVITGAKTSYNIFMLNDELLENNKNVTVGYIAYKVTLGKNTITLTKQDKEMVYGGSEHFKEINAGHDEKMTAANLSPMMVEVGLTTVRFDFYFSKLFTVLDNDELKVNEEYVAQVQGVIDELKANGGVTDFLGVFWTLLPNEYPVTWSGKPWTEKVCPDYKTEKNAYLKWLQINSEAARLTAELFKDVTNFETWNEAEIMQEEDGLIARKDGTNYSVTEKAKILTDLMYYYNKAIKSVNPNNKLTTPSLCTKQDTTPDSNFDIPSKDFLILLYEEIVNDTPVTGFTVVDKDPNHYFDVINIHPYIEEDQTPANWYLYVKTFHDVSVTYEDSGTEIWGTEFGFPTNTRTDALTKTTACLTLTNDLEFLTKLYFYKVHDYTSRINGDKWGLYDYDGNIKPLGELVKNFINNIQD